MNCLLSAGTDAGHLCYGAGLQDTQESEQEGARGVHLGAGGLHAAARHIPPHHSVPRQHDGTAPALRGIRHAVAADIYTYKYKSCFYSVYSL